MKKEVKRLRSTRYSLVRELNELQANNEQQTEFIKRTTDVVSKLNQRIDNIYEAVEAYKTECNNLEDQVGILEQKEKCYIKSIKSLKDKLHQQEKELKLSISKGKYNQVLSELLNSVQNFAEENQDEKDYLCSLIDQLEERNKRIERRFSIEISKYKRKLKNWDEIIQIKDKIIANLYEKLNQLKLNFCEYKNTIKNKYFGVKRGKKINDKKKINETEYIKLSSSSESSTSDENEYSSSENDTKSKQINESLVGWRNDKNWKYGERTQRIFNIIN